MSKPGIPPQDLAGGPRRLLDASGVELTGVMMHAGRHTTSLHAWSGMMQRFVEVIAWLREASGGWEPLEIDIGGRAGPPRLPPPAHARARASGPPPPPH